MIVVDNFSNIVMAYSLIKIEVNEERHIISWITDDTWFGLADYENYTIYYQQDIYPPNTEKMWKYIDGEFVEIPEATETESPFKM